MSKKLTAVILALIMVFCLAGTVLADETANITGDTSASVTADLSAEGRTIAAETKVPGEYSIKGLPGFQELLKLRAEAQQIKNDIVHNQVLIAKAIVAAKADHKDISAIVKNYRADEKKLHSDLKALWKDQRSYWKEMKAARHAKDKAKMEAAMNKILGGRRAINDKLLTVKAHQEKLLTDLQNAPQKTVTTQTQTNTQVDVQDKDKNKDHDNSNDNGNHKNKGLGLGKILREKIKNRND